jgi:hypothetical protein
MKVTNHSYLLPSSYTSTTLHAFTVQPGKILSLFLKQVSISYIIMSNKCVENAKCKFFSLFAIKQRQYMCLI